MLEVHTLHFPTLDSTNQWAKIHADELDPHVLTCITADVQTAGKGRRGRTWISKKGNLHMTLFFVLRKNDPRLINLGQILAFATTGVLQKHGVTVQMKWPNDLLVEGKKLAGILVETTSLGESLGIIAGMGMNIDVPVATDQPTTSLSSLSREKWDLGKLKDEITCAFQKELELGFSKDRYEPFLAFLGETVVHNEERGICMGLSEEGYLLLKKEDGRIVKIVSGDVTE